VHFLNRAVVALIKSRRIAGLFPSTGNILHPSLYGKVYTAIRVRQDAPFYEQLECSNGELAGQY